MHLKTQDPGNATGLTSVGELLVLRRLVIKVENFFNVVVEPNKGHTVDMEVAHVNNQWCVVQARGILIDE